MQTTGTTQTFEYSLTGADTACSSGAGSAANSCGIHVHSGMTCTGDAGGHYFTGAVTSDPWTSIAYTSDASSGTSSGTVTVDTGALSTDINGRALIVHAYDGSRIACAILGTGASNALVATAFVPYDGYAGDLAVAGTVGPMTTSGTTQTFYYTLTGADTACSSGAGGAANSCGIHIHSGMTCTGDAGGHYFTGAVTNDPWTSIAYTASDTGTSSGTVTLDTGGTGSDINGRARLHSTHTPPIERDSSSPRD